MVLLHTLACMVDVPVTIVPWVLDGGGVAPPGWLCSSVSSATAPGLKPTTLAAFKSSSTMRCRPSALARKYATEPLRTPTGDGTVSEMGVAGPVGGGPAGRTVM